MTAEFLDAEDFIRQRTRVRTCPFCGHDDWFRVPEVNGIVVTKAAPEDPDGVSEDPPLLRLPAVAWQCGNCGFLRIHAHDSIPQETDPPSDTPGTT